MRSKRLKVVRWPLFRAKASEATSPHGKVTTINLPPKSYFRIVY